jgi:hypothetical protein
VQSYFLSLSPSTFFSSIPLIPPLFTYYSLLSLCRFPLSGFTNKSQVRQGLSRWALLCGQPFAFELSKAASNLIFHFPLISSFHFIFEIQWFTSRMADTSIHVKWFFVINQFSKLFWQICCRSWWQTVAYIKNT